jgi:hypothetical protein
LIVILDVPRIPLIAHILGYGNSNKQTSGFSFPHNHFFYFGDN